MSTLGMIAVGLAVVVVAATLATRRKAIDPLARRADRKTAESAGIAATFKLLRAHAGVLDQVAAELRAGRKIDAIKVLRETTGLGLTDAKQVVDELEAQIAKNGPLARLLEPPAGS